MTLTQSTDGATRYYARDFFGALFDSEHLDGFVTLFHLGNRKTLYVPRLDLQAVVTRYLDNADSESMEDLYFGVGIQRNKPINGGRGVATDITAIPAVWFDLDCLVSGSSRQNLPTRPQALEFLDSLPWKPSIIINSGGGYHAYWLFKEPWIFDSDAEWTAAAQLSADFHHTVQAWGTDKGWLFDMTADLSRILRVPGTINAKRDPKVMVSILRLDSDLRYDPSDFQPYLIESEATVRNQVTRPCLPRHSFANLSVEPILEGCNWFRHCVYDAPTLPEPEWFAMLTILAKLKDGHHLAHQYSRPYSRYSLRETDWKFDHATTLNSFSCRKIDSMTGGKHCASCQYREKIIGPLSLSEKDAYLAELEELRALIHKDDATKIRGGN